MASKTCDNNDLDNVYEDSIFSITEDAQYPLFDAAKAKRDLLKASSMTNKTWNTSGENAEERSKFSAKPSGSD
jgi:hypothetical protein